MIGIVQGRLTYSGKKLQSFPKDPYSEFSLASKLNYDYIEFFSEGNLNKKNPIWSEQGIKKYLLLSKKYNLKIYSFCDNYVIKNSISNKKTLKYILHILDRLSLLKVKKYIIPLYEKSEFSNKDKTKIIKNLRVISKKCIKLKIKLLVESDMSPNDFFELKKSVNSKNIFFLFDSGNRSALKRNFINDILKFGNQIKLVHLKDKDEYKKNVLIGKGLVDFNALFKNLKNINYKGNFTIESQRGTNISKQAKKNYIFFKNLILKNKI